MTKLYTNSYRHYTLIHLPPYTHTPIVDRSIVENVERITRLEVVEDC